MKTWMFIAVILAVVIAFCTVILSLVWSSGVWVILGVTAVFSVGIVVIGDMMFFAKKYLD